MADTSPKSADAWGADLFRLLVENSHDYAIFVVDTDGRVLTWNPGAERLLGYREAEIIGRSSFVIFTPEDRRAGEPERELQTALAEGRAKDDRWHVRQDGSRFWASGIMAPLRDKAGHVRGLAKVLRDRTDQKAADMALRESEGRLRVALLAAQVGTWLWRIPTDEQILDDNLHRLMGLGPGEEVLDLSSFLRAVHEDDRARTREAFE